MLLELEYEHAICSFNANSDFIPVVMIANLFGIL